MHKAYKDAGYDKQKWKTPKATSDVVGVHDTPDGEVVVEHVAVGASGLPEFKISRVRTRTRTVSRPDPDGRRLVEDRDEHLFAGAVTVCCEDVARAYLEQFGVTAKSNRKEPRAEIPKIDVGHWREP